MSSTTIHAKSNDFALIYPYKNFPEDHVRIKPLSFKTHKNYFHLPYKELIKSWNTLKSLGKREIFLLFSSGSSGNIGPQDRPATDFDPHHARVALAQLRWKTGPRGRCERLAQWNPQEARQQEMFPLSSLRVILQDFTGVPFLRRLGCDARCGGGAKKPMPRTIEPIVPVDLVVDHSVQVDRSGTRRCFHV